VLLTKLFGIGGELEIESKIGCRPIEMAVKLFENSGLVIPAEFIFEYVVREYKMSNSEIASLTLYRDPMS